MGDNVNWDICFLCQDSVSLFNLVHKNFFLLFLIYIRTEKHFETSTTVLTNKYYFIQFIQIQFSQTRLIFSVIIALMNAQINNYLVPFFDDSKLRVKQTHLVFKSDKDMFHMNLLLNFPLINISMVISMNMTSFCCYKLFKFPVQI